MSKVHPSQAGKRRGIIRTFGTAHDLVGLKGELKPMKEISHANTENTS